MNLLEDVTKMVSCADIFSKNESIEEVSTPNVKFLLLPVLLGTLTLKLTSGDRLEIVKTAEMYFRDFLQRCKDYGIKEDIDIPPFENPEDSNASETDTFSTRNVDMLSMARRRASKIQQYHEQKELESKMALLKKVSPLIFLKMFVFKVFCGSFRFHCCLKIDCKCVFDLFKI